MRRLGLLLIIWMAIGTAIAQQPTPSASQPPTPTGGDRQSQNQAKPTNDGNPSQTGQRGTDDAPLSVKIVNAADIQPHAAPNPQASKQGAPPQWWPWPEVWPHPDWALNGLTLCLVIIGSFQIWIFGLQARRLRQTIKKMDELAAAQAVDTKEFIATTRKIGEAQASGLNPTFGARA